MNSKSTFQSVVFVIVLMISSMHAFAQSDPITIEAELSRSRVYVGDELTYQIIVRGSNNPSTPKIDFPPTVRAQYHGRSEQSFTSMRTLNGRSSTVTDRRYSYQYTLTALAPGIITIPAPTLKANAQQFVGNELSFESILPAVSDEDTLEMTVQRNEIYLNETVEVVVSWWIGAQTSEFSFSSSILPESFRVRGIEPAQGTGQPVRPFDVNGHQMAGTAAVDSNDPAQRTRFVFRFSITPTETGAFDLGPMRAIFTRHTGTGRNYRAYVDSEPVQITVRRVPTENQPDGYTGAIGAFSLELQASNTQVNVGDPIGLTLWIKAPEPMNGIDDAPDLRSDARFTDHFKISSDGWREIRPRRAGQRGYETTIRALDEHVDQIPPIELPSFNPSTQSYRIYRSNPIPIHVQSVDEITLSDAIVTGGTNNDPPPTQSIERTELTRAMPGLWAHGTADELFAQEHGFSIAQALHDPVWISAIASGPSVFMLSLLIVLARGSSDPRAQALRKAWRQSIPLARRGEHAHALRIYLAGALDMNEDAVTAQDAYRLGINDDDAELIAQLLIADEHADYVGNGQSSTNQPQPRHGLLKEIHAQVRTTRRARS